jgi:hypothetical protein
LAGSKEEEPPAKKPKKDEEPSGSQNGDAEGPSADAEAEGKDASTSKTVVKKEPQAVKAAKLKPKESKGVKKE